MSLPNYRIFLDEAVKEGSLGHAVMTSNPAALRDILTTIREEAEEEGNHAYHFLEFYLHPKEPEVLLIVNSRNHAGPLDDLTFEILEESDGS